MCQSCCRKLLNSKLDLAHLWILTLANQPANNISWLSRGKSECEKNGLGTFLKPV